MNWLISYKFSIFGKQCEKMEVTKYHPLQFLRLVNQKEGYRVICIYSVIEIPFGTVDDLKQQYGEESNPGNITKTLPL